MRAASGLGDGRFAPATDTDLKVGKALVGGPGKIALEESSRRSGVIRRMKFKDAVHRRHIASPLDPICAIREMILTGPIVIASRLQVYAGENRVGQQYRIFLDEIY